MPLPNGDVILTGLVAAAGLLYLLWAIGFALPGMTSSRAIGVSVPRAGIAASASAVVPTVGAPRVITGRTYPSPRPRAPAPNAARPPTASCSPLTIAKPQKGGSDHAD